MIFGNAILNGTVEKCSRENVAKQRSKDIS